MDFVQMWTYLWWNVVLAHPLERCWCKFASCYFYRFRAYQIPPSPPSPRSVFPMQQVRIYPLPIFGRHLLFLPANLRLHAYVLLIGNRRAGNEDRKTRTMTNQVGRPANLSKSTWFVSSCNVTLTLVLTKNKPRMKNLFFLKFIYIVIFIMPNINTSVRNNIYKKNYIIIMITCSEETRQETKKPMRPTENSLKPKAIDFWQAWLSS